MAIERDYSGDPRLDPTLSHSGTDSVSRVGGGGTVQNGATYEGAISARVVQGREPIERVTVIDPEREPTIPRPPEITIFEGEPITREVHPIASEARPSKTSANVEPAPEPEPKRARGILPWIVLPVALVAYLIR